MNLSDFHNCLGLTLTDQYSPACSGASLEGTRGVGGGQLLPMCSQLGRAERDTQRVLGCSWYIVPQPWPPGLYLSSTAKARVRSGLFPGLDQRLLIPQHGTREQWTAPSLALDGSGHILEARDRKKMTLWPLQWSTGHTYILPLDAAK